MAEAARRRRVGALSFRYALCALSALLLFPPTTQGFYYLKSSESSKQAAFGKHPTQNIETFTAVYLKTHLLHELCAFAAPSRPLVRTGTRDRRKDSTGMEEDSSY